MRDKALPAVPMPGSIAWPAVAVVYAAAFVQGMTLVSFPALSAVLKETLGLSDAAYGAIFLPQVACAVLGALAGGSLARKLGLRALLALALAGNGLSQGLLAATAMLPGSTGITVLFVGTACLGLGFGLSGAPINSYPRLLFPEKGEPALVAAHTLIGLGLATAPLAAAPLIEAGSWASLPLLLALVCAALAAAVLITALPQPADVTTGASHPRPPVAAPLFWLFAAITVVYAFAEGTFANWAVIYLRDNRGLPEMTAGLALSAFWGAIVAGRLLITLLVVYIPARVIWLTLPCLMIAAFWLLPLADSALTGIGFFALAGLACSAFLPLTISLAVERFPQAVAWVSSMLIAALMVGVGIGSWLVGALQAALPLETLYRLSSAYPLTVLLLAGLVVRSAAAHRAGPAPAQ
ncbi:MAG: MFS transporter [Defluviicoccus sp.]